MKKKTTFKRIDKNTGIESEIHVATAAEPIKDRAIIEGIKTALNTKKTRKYYALFCTGINTALRISDILKLRVSDVESGYVHTTETKTGKRKQFPINDSLMAVLTRQKLLGAIMCKKCKRIVQKMSKKVQEKSLLE